MFIPIIIAGILFFSIMIPLFVFLFKLALKKQHFHYSYKGLKKSSIKFKTFDTFYTSNFQVRSGKEYILDYDLATETGTVSVKVNDDFYIETKDHVTGSIPITFDRLQPIISFVGDGATNGHAKVQLRQ